MKTQRFIWMTAVVAILVITAVMLRDKREPSGLAVSSAPEPAASTADPVDSRGDLAPTPEPARPVPANRAGSIPAQLENVVPEAGDGLDQVVRLKPDQVLATVNGVAITLRDLVPLLPEKAGSEQMMSVEMFDFLFNRAIERELTVQAAQAQGVALTETQKRSLEDLKARSEQADPNVFDTVQQNPANTEFMLRDFSGLMLQATLAASAGLPSQYVTQEHVQQYYREHTAEYETLPLDAAARQNVWQRIDADIRTKLAPRIEAEYHERLQLFLDQLKAKANITITPPPAA